MTDRDGEDQAFVDAISEWPDINDGPPTLSGFLLARIADDERAIVDGGACHCGDDAQRPDCAGRLARECEAKRRIVTECLLMEEHPDGIIGDYGDTILRLLAAPYAEHSDYRRAWRP